MSKTREPDVLVRKILWIDEPREFHVVDAPFVFECPDITRFLGKWWMETDKNISTEDRNKCLFTRNKAISVWRNSFVVPN